MLPIDRASPHPEVTEHDIIIKGRHKLWAWIKRLFNATTRK